MIGDGERREGETEVAMRKSKTWIVWGVVRDDADVVPTDHCRTLDEAMRSPLPGIIHEYDFVAGVYGGCGTFLNGKAVGVNDKLRQRLH